MRVASGSRSDRGAATAIFVLFLSAALGLAALVVDVGISWQERRQVITSTDAAALAAVQDFVTGDNAIACTVTAPDAIDDNNVDANMTGCAHTAPSGGNAGWVTVDAESDVDFIFAGILGINSTTVTSSTSANYDLASTVDGGLRPFGLCIDHLTELGMAPADGVVYRIYYGRTAQVTNCNGDDPISGNWGILDFDGGSNSQNDIKDWTQDGYDGSVSIGDWIEGTPGSYSNSLNSELQHLRDNVDHFTLPIFSEYNLLGGGNAEFLIANFVSVRLSDFQTTGSQDDRYVDIEFLKNVVQGGGGGTSTGLGAYVIGICAVDGVNAASTCP